MLALILALLPAIAGPPALVRVPVERWPRFHDTGDLARLEAALELQAEWLARRPRHRSWPLGDRTVTAARLRATCLALLEIVRARADFDLALRARFELYASAAGGDTGQAAFTAYCNPVFAARLAPDSVFRYPLYRPPPDPRRSRREIETQGALDREGGEIAWLRDPFERYLVHVEGSATLRLEDGSTVNALYAGRNGHPYVSLGGELIRAGLLHPDSLTSDAVRAVLARRPEGPQPWFDRNLSYIYFRLSPDPPTGSTGIRLLPGRSVAADHAVFPPGTLFWAAVSVPAFDSAGAPVGNAPWAGFVLNHDVGSAVRGPQRMDLFWGTGDSAATVAGRLNRRGRLYVLLLKEP